MYFRIFSAIRDHGAWGLFPEKEVLMRLAAGIKPAPRLRKIVKVVPLLLIPAFFAAIAISADHAIVRKQSGMAITLSGIVSDSVCGNDHGVKATGDADCTRSCIYLGAQYALMVGPRMYILQGHESDLDRFAGTRVRVIGRVLKRDTVAVDQVIGWYTETVGGKQ
jgi:hypothetical protein